MGLEIDAGSPKDFARLPPLKALRMPAFGHKSAGCQGAWAIGRLGGWAVWRGRNVAKGPTSCRLSVWAVLPAQRES